MISNTEKLLIVLTFICAVWLSFYVGLTIGKDGKVPYKTLYDNNITVEHNGYKRYIIRQKTGKYANKLQKEMEVEDEKK